MTRSGRFRVSADHPALAGHFPGRPIVPGVVLLEEVLRIAGRDPAASHGVRIEAARFTAPVLPDQDVTVTCSVGPGGRLAFACRVGDRPVLHGHAVLPGVPHG